MPKPLNVLHRGGTPLATDSGEEPLRCPRANGCAMFELLKVAGALRTWQIRYCGADYSQCARYKATELGRPVAPNLMPNGQYLRFSGERNKA
jgi:hypothetical protein